MFNLVVSQALMFLTGSNSGQSIIILVAEETMFV